MAIVPSTSGSIDAFAMNQTHLVLDISSYFAPVTALSITTMSLPAAATSTDYTSSLGATGGLTPYTWSIVSGSLPQGLSLSDSGVISGTPATTGTYTFSV